VTVLVLGPGVRVGPEPHEVQSNALVAAIIAAVTFEARFVRIFIFGPLLRDLPA
jgi:hypothetical protein